MLQSPMVNSVTQRRAPMQSHLRRSSSVPNLRSFQDVELSPRTYGAAKETQIRERERKLDHGHLVCAVCGVMLLGALSVWAFVVRLARGS